MKLYIAILGLYTIVPAQGWVDILFLESESRHSSAGSIPEHDLRVKFATPSRSSFNAGPPFVFVDLRLEGPVDLRILEATDQPVTFVNRKGFVHLADVLGLPESPPLRPGCTGPEAVTTCTSLSGEPLLSGRLRLTDGTLRPAEIFPGKVYVNADVTESQKAIWDFVPLGTENIGPSSFGQKTFNGSLYELQVPSNEVTLSTGGAEIILEPADLSICSALGGIDNSPCTFLLIANTVIQMPPTPDDSICVVDSHFELTYDLLQDPIPERPVPHLRVDAGKVSVLQDDDENPPGSRCIPPIQGPGSGSGS